MTATLIDIVTTTALIATPQGRPGVSIDLTINYLAPAKLGETIIIDAWVNKLGKTLGYTSANIYRKSDNTKIVTALHTKAFPIGYNKLI
ncbi:4HBT domain-containing protein [Meloidogyne graminicola]|uniref:4HBT domain-containing protein n=1 Tax=Meloidogyne graminicola TaxID=189291 RepID=A0A8S9ZE60_9BILA|nr:4HBT domain-containing protein [Meloidogyne graminicola]